MSAPTICCISMAQAGFHLTERACPSKGRRARRGRREYRGRKERKACRDWPGRKVFRVSQDRRENKEKSARQE